MMKNTYCGVDGTSTRTDKIDVTKPEKRKIRNYSENIKATCAKVVYLLVYKSCTGIAVKTTCKLLYGYNIYLTAEEQMSSEPKRL